jgi:uncharacterized protein Veg
MEKLVKGSIWRSRLTYATVEVIKVEGDEITVHDAVLDTTETYNKNDVLTQCDFIQFGDNDA